MLNCKTRIHGAWAACAAALALANEVRADFYVWHDMCVSDSWYACCQDVSGDYHNNWWLTPYGSCPPSNQYPEDADDADILTSSVYLDSAARVYNFNSDGAFRLLPAPGQLEVHDLATLAGTFQWDGGTLAGWGPATLFQLETVATIDTSSVKNLAAAEFQVLAGASANAVGDGTILLNASAFHTLPSATDPGEFNVSVDLTIGQNPSGGAGSFLNEGLFDKIGGGGTTAIDIAFDNPGRVEVHSGILLLSGGGTGTGDMDVDAGAVLDFYDYTLAGGASFPGLGLVRVPGPVGILYVQTGASVAIPIFEMSGYQTGGGGALHLNGTFDWKSGSLMAQGVGTPTVTIDATGVATLSGAGGKSASFGTLNVAGNMIFGGTGNLALGLTAFNTLATGTFDIQTDADIDGICCAGSGELTNAGIWLKSAGGGETVVNKHLTNTGTVEIRSGLLTFQSSDYHQTAGLTRLNGGNLSIIYRLWLNGGVVDGNGTLTAYYLNNVAGDVRPGLSAGTLTIAPPTFLSGNYAQESGGKLSIEVGGTTPGTQHDRLIVDNVAFLGGTLAISLINDFVPAIGDEFVVMTYGSRVGTFATVTGTAISANKAFGVIYNATNVTLRVVDTCGFAPCDVNCDGTVNPFDISPFLGALGSSPPAPCSPCAADANGDGTVNPFDIGDFLVCLSS